MSEFFEFWTQDASIQINSALLPVIMLADEIEGAAPDREMISIPGRNGDLHIDKGRYLNRTRKITLYCKENAKEVFAGINAKLLAASRTGYGNLESSLYKYTPAGTTGRVAYRMYAIYKGGYFPSKYTPNHTAEIAVLEFDCKPEMWKIASGVTVASGYAASLVNDTMFDSCPTIDIAGTGYVRFGNGTWVNVTTQSPYGDGYIRIDCRQKTIYGSATKRNCSSCVSMSNNEFPYVPANKTSFGITNNASGSVVIYNNTYTL